jgi:dipeptidyl-peptidase-4
MRSRTLARGALLAVTLATAARSQESDPSTLTLPRIFASREFFGQRFGPARWLATGDAYTTLEPAASGTGADIVRYDAETGRRIVLVPASRLVPRGATDPLEIEDYSWSPDAKRVLRSAYGGRTRAAISGCSTSRAGRFASSAATPDRRR